MPSDRIEAQHLKSQFEVLENLLESYAETDWPDAGVLMRAIYTRDLLDEFIENSLTKRDGFLKVAEALAEHCPEEPHDNLFQMES